MKPTSIRWWLPLSYGAIAFITAVALGIVLLAVLKSFYTWQERRYLEENATAVAGIIQQLLETEATNLLPSQINTFAYLTQTQIDVYDAEGELLASSQNPSELQAVATLSLQVNTDDSRQEMSQSVSSTNTGQAITSLLVIEQENGRFASESSISGNVGGLGTVEGFAAPLLQLQTPGQYGLGTTNPSQRSDLIVQQNITSHLEGKSLGSIVLLNGPAFGDAVFTSVAVGITIAGSIAVLLATAVGWWMTHRLNRPIQTLVEAADQMAAGDLTVRTASQQPEELDKLAHSFNVMAARIEQTISTLRYFVADAAHELNTPLTALRTNLELAHNAAPENIYLTDAQSQALRLQQLNDNLLRLSRLESGLATEKTTQVNLQTLTAERCEAYAAQAEQAGLRFTAVLPDTPLFVSGHEESLISVIDNLLDNALKFTPVTGQVQISLQAEGQWANLTVSDTGIGIADAELALIYGRFHRGHNASDYPGSGLGLAIVKAIVTGYGGSVTAVSLDQGTKFIVRFPVMRI